MSIIIPLENTATQTAQTALLSTYAALGQTGNTPTPVLEGNLNSFNHDYGEDGLRTYWYHPDHLGSSSYITNVEGIVTQHMEYMPYGESLVEEHQNSINTPYKFNGKEQDDETGNYYYGARYYNPKFSFWLSVDPLAEKFYDLSPYAYVSNNPLRYTDPTGMGQEDTYGVDKYGTICHLDNQKYYDTKGNELDKLVYVDNNGNVDKSKGSTFSTVNRDGSSLVSDLFNSKISKTHAKDMDGNTFQKDMFFGFIRENKKKEAFSTFKFLADNGDVEWSILKFNSKSEGNFYQISTYGLDGTVSGPNDSYGKKYSPGLIFKNVTFLGIMHSHGNESSFKGRDEGLYWDSTVGRRYHIDHGNKPYHVYFPKLNSVSSMIYGTNLFSNSNKFPTF